MELKVGGVCKAFIAVRALKGSLTRMGTLMLLAEKLQQEKREEKWRNQLAREDKSIKYKWLSLHRLH